jgi:parallel beta-helix repeat protein
MRVGAFLAWGFLLLSSFLWPSPAQAAEGYDNCTGFIDSLPANISEQGVWCLRKDLNTAITFGDAIRVNGNNITIDCNNFKLGGLAAGTATEANGIASYTSKNLTIRRCNIRGFLTGVLVYGQYQYTRVIEDNRIEGNTREGIVVVGGKGSVIRRNLVLDTGGSTWGSPSPAYAIQAQGGANVIDNTISGVIAGGDGSGNAGAYGIYATNNADGVVRGNRVRGLVSQGGATYGIISSQSNPTSLRDNDLSGTGAANSFGLYSYITSALANDNIFSRY